MSNACNLISIAAYVPEKVLTNSEIASFVDTNEQWIIERTGIRRRRQLSETQNTSDLGFLAAQMVLNNQKFEAKNLTHIIVATCTPDCLAPSTACIIGGKLETGPIMAFDLGAACAGFIYGLYISKSIVRLDSDSQILFICAEAMTRRLNWHDRSTCVLFGDAASACIINGTEKNSLCSIVDVICQSDGRQKDLITVGGGTACKYDIDTLVDEKFFLSMQGRETYKFAVRNMVSVCNDLLLRNNLQVADIDVFIPHQANIRIIEAVGTRLGISQEKVFINLMDYGNTSAASIPLAITEAWHCGKIKTGSRVLVAAFGAGLTWGAALLHF